MKAWILSLLLSLAPTPYPIPGREETADAYAARLDGIAEDIAAVAQTPGQASLLVAVAFLESGFAVDTDVGPTCYRGRDGKSPRCDGGRAASMWQIKIGSGTTREGWTQVDLFADRRKAARAALSLIGRSLRACGGGDAALDVYAGGKCSTSPESPIRKAGKMRLDLARRLLARWVPGV